MNDLVEVRGLCKSFHTGTKTLHVLRNLDLAVAPGEMVAVVGESGVGKSTLLHLLGALDRPDEGAYSFGGIDVLRSTGDQLAKFRNTRIGFVFQFHHLLSEFTALENVMIAGLIGGGSRTSSLARARGLLDELGVADRGDHLPSQMSGGEQQRVAIARALMTAGDLLLADEPTGNLDIHTSSRVFNVLRSVQRSHRIAVVMATHNERLAAACDRTLQLHEGVLGPSETRDPHGQEIARP